MSEKELELQLLNNPKYSSGWIQNAVHLIIKCGLTEQEVARFDTEQLQLLVSMFTSAEQNQGIWIDGFLNPLLNATQMQLLITGYSHNLTTEQLKPFFNPEVPYVKSNWYIMALIDGFDLTKYDINAYDPDQIREIYSGIKDEVDVSTFDDVSIPAEKMAIARHALVLGLKPQFDENKLLTI